MGWYDGPGFHTMVWRDTVRERKISRWGLEEWWKVVLCGGSRLEKDVEEIGCHFGQPGEMMVVVLLTEMLIHEESKNAGAMEAGVCGAEVEAT